MFRKLETELLQPETRRDPIRLRALLADEFVEFGASGRVYTKAEVIEFLQREEPVALELTDFIADQLADDVVLATYRALRHEPGAPTAASLRSSLWVRQGDSWRMRFHQGTRTG